MKGSSSNRAEWSGRRGGHEGNKSRVKGQRIEGHCPVAESLLPLMDLSIFTSLKKKKKA